MPEIGKAEQTNTVYAVVAGKPVTSLPTDLFIPPNALEVLLDSFSGPLDLLLYLIRRQNIDILDIPIAHVSQQYMQYIQLIEVHQLELAAEYLLMAAMLAEIKSRLLLPPRLNPQEELEEDPRLELVRKLQTYEMFKHAATAIDNMPRCERDIFPVTLSWERVEHTFLQPEVELSLLVEVMRALINKQSHYIHHQITKEVLSVRDRMMVILSTLQEKNTLHFGELFKHKEGRMGLVVSLLAILELARQSLLLVTQLNPYGTIHIQAIVDGNQ